jgi:hypothetical protein
MDWCRVKTSLIVFMLLVNLALLGLWGWRVYSAERVRTGARAELVRLLAEQGLEIGEAVLPDERLSAVTLEIPRDPDYERGLVSGLVGAVTAEDAGGNVTDYFRDGARVASFSTGGEFWIQAGEPLQLTEWDGVPLDEQLALRQTVGGLPVWNCEITAAAARVEGRWVPGQPYAVRSLPGRNAAFALLKLAQRLEGTHSVRSVELGYIAAAASSETVRLTPVWRVALDDREVLLNAVTGEE